MIALVVPCHASKPWDVMCVERLVDSVKRQTMPPDMVILVDDDSSVPLNVPTNGVTCLRLSFRSGPAKARNAGIAKAMKQDASQVLMTDHDCILDANWVRSMSSFLMGSEFGAAGGITRAWGRTLIDQFHDINGTLNGRWILPERKELLYGPTCNFGMRAEVVRDFRFDERFHTAAGEDVDVCLRIRQKHKIGLCRSAVVLHDYGYRNSLMGISRLVATFKKYKRANWILYEKHPEYFTDSWQRSEAISSKEKRCRSW